MRYMTANKMIISSKDLTIDWDWVKYHLLKKERIKPPDDGKPSNTIIACVDECLEKASILVTPKMAFAEKKITSLKPDFLEVDRTVTLCSRTLSSYMNGASHLYFFVVTLGSGLEDMATRWMNEGESLHGYILDRIGSFAVESLAECLEVNLRNACSSKELGISMRFSPGYCDWPVEEQLKLNKLIDFSRAGVRLTASCMMVPKKSISAVVGIAPKGSFLKVKSQCVICKTADCSYRRDF